MSRYATSRAKHGGRKLAVLEKCPCEACDAYRADHRRKKAANDLQRQARRRQSVTSLGDSQLADEVVLERVRIGDQTPVLHPDDRAGIVAAVARGTITKQRALAALRCSGEALATELASLQQQASAA